MDRPELFADPLRQKAADLTKAMTEEEKLHLLSTHHAAVPRLGLKEFFIGHEVARGFVGREEENWSTVFPQPIGLAGTFDKELMRQLGDIAGDECRAYYNRDKRGCLCVWGPTVDMERDPRWGRTEEAYGEDVCLAGEMTAAYTRGLAGDHPQFMKTVPTLKHFCANNNEHHRGSCDAYIPPRLKYEYYYAAFMNAIRFGGARSVMTAYNEINGLPAMLNPELNTVLKEKWGLWFAVTDGGDFSQTVTAHRFFERHSQTLAAALKAGCDTMTDISQLVEEAARQALSEGILTWEEIDRSIENTLYARLKLGHTAESTPWDGLTQADVSTPSSEQVNLRAAREQIVLLKNDGLLPIPDDGGSIAVVGPLCRENLMDWYTGNFRSAVDPVTGISEEFSGRKILSDSLWDHVAVKAPNGRYLSVHEDGTVRADSPSIGENEIFELQDQGENWQNLFSVKHQRYLRLDEEGVLRLHGRRIYDWFTRETFRLFPTENGTITEELLHGDRLFCNEDGTLEFTEKRAVSPNVIFRYETVSSGRDRAAELAKNSRYVVYCTGNHPVQVAKECFDRKTLALNIQPGMCQLLHSANPRTVLALISSYPYSVVEESQTLPAVIYSTHAGPHLGTALAEALSGKYSPAGRLAMTWYRSELDLPDIMDYDIENGGTTYMYFTGKPLFPFGFGLSYAKFDYTALSVSDNGSGLSAKVTLRNSSETDSDEVIQVYYSVPGSKVSRPIRKLCAFERVFLRSGEEKTVALTIPEHILQIWDVRKGEMITESGEYVFSAGGSSSSLPLSAKLTLNRGCLSQRGRSFSADSFDSAKGIRIGWDKHSQRHFVYCRGWNGTLDLGGVPAAGKAKLTLTASSVTGPKTISAKIGDAELELPICASDSTSSFASYSAALPKGLTDDSRLTISLSEGLALLDIALS
ncbi:MAG TPA: glycoside hydrolase family 3 C-terminal domain-containing protein [Ruminococcus sp.]|nr:glycoside hydrolase family 3 C-terminal domain-containing protein [Ruminococcus sp.]